jgi:hypothetical protein
LAAQKMIEIRRGFKTTFKTLQTGFKTALKKFSNSK